jgi:hypothetical protein
MDEDIRSKQEYINTPISNGDPTAHRIRLYLKAESYSVYYSTF